MLNYKGDSHSLSKTSDNSVNKCPRVITGSYSGLFLPRFKFLVQKLSETEH